MDASQLLCPQQQLRRIHRRRRKRHAAVHRGLRGTPCPAGDGGAAVGHGQRQTVLGGVPGSAEKWEKYEENMVKSRENMDKYRKNQGTYGKSYGRNMGTFGKNWGFGKFKRQDLRFKQQKWLLIHNTSPVTIGIFYTEHLRNMEKMQQRCIK